VKRLALAIALTAALIGLGGCGSRAPIPGDRISGTTLTIYSSLPMHGASSASANAILRGEQLALAQAKGRVGKYQIVLKSLDDSTIQRGEWDPGQTTVNARLASTDTTTIGYVGEFNSGASAVSIPVLNRMGIAQLSPASTAVGLTENAPGASPGEPQKYYPTGTRTYARVIPNDAVQATAQLRLQLDAGCTETFVLDDGEVDGQDTTTSFIASAQSSRLKIAGDSTFDPRASDYTSLATAIAQSGATCLFVSAVPDSNVSLLTRQVAAAAGGLRIFGSAGVAIGTYTNPPRGSTTSALDQRMLLTVAALQPSSYPATSRVFFADYSQLYGTPQPYAIYGYETMSLMLDAISRATHGGKIAAQRSKVVAAIFKTRNRHSVLGTYSINGNGDTTLTRYGVYRVVDGRLEFARAIDA
jgi:branched-chain amino acid transport system substrate-binding protein